VELQDAPTSTVNTSLKAPLQLELTSKDKGKKAGTKGQRKRQRAVEAEATQGTAELGMSRNFLADGLTDKDTPRSGRSYEHAFGEDDDARSDVAQA
jgi:hypothetical protein